jgi:hypothetical protein
VGFVEAALGRILDGAVHPLDPTARPGMLGLGQPMIDIVEGAGIFESVRGRAAAGRSSPLISAGKQVSLAKVGELSPLSERTVWTR